MENPGVLDTIRSCRFCFMCRHACPTFLATKYDSHTPRGFALLLSEVHEGLRDWTEDFVERFYQCSLCGLCREDCLFHWPEDELVRQARAEIAAAGRAPSSIKHLSSLITQEGSPFGRLDPAAGVPASVPARGEVLYWPGCTARKNQPEIIRAVGHILDAIGSPWSRLDDEGCCGMPFLDLGYPELAHHAISALADRISAVHPQIVVTSCPHCYRMLTERIPEERRGSLSDVQVMHTSEFLVKAIATARLRFRHSWAGSRIVGYHDPCQLGRKLGVYEAPRNVILAATGKPPVELIHNRAGAECCGGGGAMILTNHELVTRIATLRLKAAMQERVDILVSSCPTCKTALGMARDQQGMNIDLVDIVEMAAMAL